MPHAILIVLLTVQFLSQASLQVSSHMNFIPTNYQYFNNTVHYLTRKRKKESVYGYGLENVPVQIE